MEEVIFTCALSLSASTMAPLRSSPAIMAQCFAWLMPDSSCHHASKGIFEPGGVAGSAAAGYWRATMAIMAECIHGLEEVLCGACGDQRERASSRMGLGGTMAGKSFALIYAPSIRHDTFLHLNREGVHWKIRWYRSPNEKPFEIAQSGLASTRRVYNLRNVPFVYEVAYPYSTSPGGVSVEKAQYWFDEIAKINAKHEVSALSPRPHAG